MRYFAVCLVAFVLLSLSRNAIGQDDLKEAKAAFDEGKSLFREKKYSEAARAFRSAYEIKPNWKLFYNIGQCEAAAKNHGLALEAFEHYLSEGGDDVPEERNEEVTKEIARLRNMVGFLEIKGRDGDAVWVNGIERGRLPDAGGLRVAMGQAQLRILRGEEVVYDQKVEIFGNQTKVVDLLEQETPEEAAPQTVAEEEVVEQDDHASPVEPEEADKPKRIATWVAFGIGGAAAVAAGITGGITLKKRSDLDDQCVGEICPSDLEDDEKKTLNLAITTDVLMGGAVLGVGAGILLYFLEPKWARGEEIAVVPTASNDRAGISVMGRF